MQRLPEDSHDHQRTSSQRANMDPGNVLDVKDSPQTLDVKAAHDLSVWSCRIALTIRWTSIGCVTAGSKNLASIVLFSRDGSSLSDSAAECHEVEWRTYCQKQNRRFRHLVAKALHDFLQLPRPWAASWTLRLTVISIEFLGSLDGCLPQHGHSRRADQLEIGARSKSELDLSPAAEQTSC